MKKFLLLVFVMILTVFSAQAAEFYDMPQDWSTQALTSAVENQLIYGSEGYILAQNNITRAEMAAVMVRAFGAEKQADISEFTDVSQDQWYYQSLAAAVEMGIFKGDGDKLNPDQPILREEAFAVIARALLLEDSDSAVVADFLDADKVSDWAKGSVSALVENQYINGSDGFILPQNTITRAEFAQVMYNIFKKYIKTSGTYTEKIEGSVIISCDGVTLKNCTVNGDIIVGDGVDLGVVLDSVKVSGRIVFRSGKENTVKNTQNINFVIPKESVTVNHDKYGIMVGGKNFDITNNILSVNPGGFLLENGVVTVPSQHVMSYQELKVSFGIYRYYTRAILAQADGGNANIWSMVKTADPSEYNTMVQQVKNIVDDVALKQHIVVYLLAKEKGVNIDQARNTAEESIKEVENQYISYGESFEEALKVQGMTAETLLELETASKVYNDLLELMLYDKNGNIAISNQEINNLISEKGYIRAQHILVDSLEKAEQVLEKLNSSEDFMSLVEQYNLDPGMDQAGENGYFFGKGEMVAEFENACHQLKPGEISGVVETSYGYHIIRRIELTQEDIKAIASVIAEQKLFEEISEKAEKIKPLIIYTQLYHKIEPANLH